MELTLTALIKIIILCWGRGSSSGDKKLETQQKLSKFEMHQLPLSLFMQLLTGPQSHIRKLREQSDSI